MNELIETLFYNFLETTNDEMDDDDVMVDVGTLRTGFYAGFAAAQRVQYVKLRYATHNLKTAQKCVTGVTE